MSRSKGNRSLGGRSSKGIKHFPPDSLVSVDVDAVKCFWDGLCDDEKLRVLRFDDRGVVERVGCVQHDLCSSDLLCYKLGIRGQNAVRQEVGMGQFNMECDDSDYNTPVVFYAKPELAERADLFGYLEERLGGSFLKKRPALQRKDWPLVFETGANSWRCFMQQVLELVELAIYEAFQKSLLPEKETGAANVECEQVLEESTDQKSQTAKRRARKKRNNLAATPAASLPEDAASSMDAYSAALDASTPVVDARFSEASTPDAEAVAGIDGTRSNEDATSADMVQSDVTFRSEIESVLEESVLESTTCRDSSHGDTAVPDGETCLNFDWNPEGPPIDEAAMESAAVELEVDWSAGPGGSGGRMETRWSAWLPNGLTGSTAEWHWVANGPPTIAFLKNTFVEIENKDPDEQRPRPRSLPARPRPVLPASPPTEL